MLISIVVPIYNIEQYINQCVDSVLEQSFQDWELILVDDGSPDKCPSICDNYASLDNRIRVVHKTNGGLVSARKAGIDVATGDYVMPLDGDDFLDGRCLCVVADYIAQNAPDVICFGYYIYSENGRIENPINVYRYGVYDRHDMEVCLFPSFIHSSTASHFPHNLWAKVYKHDLYLKYQNAVSSKIGMGEDGACTYPLIFNSQKIVILKDCLYNYRQIYSSMSKVKKPLSWDNYDLVYALYEKEIDLTKYDMQQQYYRARTHNLFDIVLSQFYSEKSFKETVESINLRFQAHPEYSTAITNSRFTSMSMRTCRFLIKNKCYLILSLIAKNKTRLKELLAFK